MSELFFFIYEYKGDTKPYYRKDDIIYNYQCEQVKSEEICSRILNNPDIIYYDFDDICCNISSIPMFVNIIYNDDDDFQSTYAIFCAKNNRKLKILTFEDLDYNIDEYIPYEYLPLYPLLSCTKRLKPFNNDFIYTENRIEIGEYNVFIKHINVEPYSRPLINPNTGFPEYILFHGLQVRFINFARFRKMLKDKKIYRYFIDESVQKWAKPPNSLFIVFGTNGVTYILNAFHNTETNKISRPKK
jgi:hypothetical protein